MTNRDEVHLLSGAYALDAVDAEEARQVEAAMRESEDLHSEVVGLSDTAVALGMALPAEAPPAALRGRLLDLIETTDQLPAEDASAEPATSEPAPTAMPAGTHVPTTRRPRRRRRLTALLAVGAAVVVLVGGGFFVQRTMLEPQNQYVALIQSPDVQLASAKAVGGGTVTVEWSKTQHQTAVVVNGASAPSGKVLQLWSVRGGTITSAGLYEPQAGQKFMLLTGTPSAGEHLAVSVEPDGGSAQPTTKPIASVDLSA
jgi:anti-sigma-K factor RskA